MTGQVIPCLIPKEPPNIALGGRFRWKTTAFVIEYNYILNKFHPLDTHKEVFYGEIIDYFPEVWYTSYIKEPPNAILDGPF